MDAKIPVIDTTSPAPSPKPKHPFLALFPDAAVPYLQLMRIDKPAGLYAIYLPYLYGLLHGATTTAPGSPPPTPSRLLFLAAVFLAGSVFLRGAGCTWNDYIDQDFDRQVQRTRSRPLARGAVSNPRALAFTLANAAAGTPLLALLPPPARVYALAVTLMSALYPFAKRVTYYPQVVLGFPFALAVPMASAAVRGAAFVSLGGGVADGAAAAASVACLFAVVLVWTVLYDTIYAFQDLRDDLRAGVKSTAVRFAAAPKVLLGFLAGYVVVLLGVTGYLAGYGLLYFGGSCVGTAAALALMIVKVDVQRPESCAWWFWANFWVVGGPIASGFLLEYGAKVWQQDSRLALA